MMESEPKEIREKIVPLADWNKKDGSKHPLLVFWEKVDDRYQVEVQRVGEGSETGCSGMLVVFDHEQDNWLLLQEKVGLAYGAPFGPDVADVDGWETRVLKFIDEELPRLQGPRL
ncbi:MAG: hypothetical protein Q8P80_04210 [Candidatus Levybacteria bacterium]|nr:hypothetical protein [Candidatus Levybacteria bacterium]